MKSNGLQSVLQNIPQGSGPGQCWHPEPPGVALSPPEMALSSQQVPVHFQRSWLRSLFSTQEFRGRRSGVPGRSDITAVQSSQLLPHSRPRYFKVVQLRPVPKGQLGDAPGLLVTWKTKHWDYEQV